MEAGKTEIWIALNTSVCFLSLVFVLFCFSEFHIQMDVVL